MFHVDCYSSFYQYFTNGRTVLIFAASSRHACSYAVTSGPFSHVFGSYVAWEGRFFVGMLLKYYKKKRCLYLNLNIFQKLPFLLLFKVIKFGKLWEGKSYLLTVHRYYQFLM